MFTVTHLAISSGLLKCAVPNGYLGKKLFFRDFERSKLLCFPHFAQPQDSQENAILRFVPHSQTLKFQAMLNSYISITKFCRLVTRGSLSHQDVLLFWIN